MTTDIDIDAAIAEAVRRLVERFDPLQVVLFGSQVRGEARPESDVDLLLVVPEANRSVDSRDVLAVVRGAGRTIDVHVRTPEQVWRECRVPGSVVRNALREGRVVYEHDERPEAARELLRFAREDLESALVLQRGGGALRIVCFLAQQAAEKALKAALLYAGIDYPLTHELDPLRTLLPDDWPLKREHTDLEWLSHWAIAGRYGGAGLTPEETEAVLTTARAILDAAVRDLRAHGLELPDA